MCIFCKYLLLLCIVANTFCSQAQLMLQGRRPGNDLLYNKLSASFLNFTYIKKDVKTLKIPKRKNAPSFFVNEIIPFRSGYIINAITTTPSAELVETRAEFYYLSKDSLGLITIPGLDTIHSIIAHENVIYASGIEQGSIKAIYSKNEEPVDLINAITWPLSAKDTRWIKLAFYRDTLYALCNNGLCVYTEGSWNLVPGSSLDDFFISHGFETGPALLPTENIRIDNNCVYFLQEITQQRTSLLFEINFNHPVRIEEFTSKNLLTDNTEKEVDGYLLLPSGIVLVALNRLMNNTMLLAEKSGSISTIILNGSLNHDVNDNTTLNVSCMLPGDDDVLLLCSNGMYSLRTNELEQLAVFENQEQNIKSGKYVYHYAFKPRSAIALDKSVYMIGGMWGGLLMADLSNSKTKWIDENSINTSVQIVNGRFKSSPVSSTKR